MARHVRFGFVFLQIIFAGLCIDLPVDVLHIVAGRVLSVFGKFDGEALKRAIVQTGQKTFDDEFGAKVEPGDLLNYFGAEILLGGRHEKIVVDSV